MKAQKSASTVKRLLVTGAACVSGACATGPQLRPVSPEPCPEGAKETHEAYAITTLDSGASLNLDQIPMMVPVKEGQVIAKLHTNFGKFPQRTLILGRLLLGSDVVYGRFTEAQLPGGEKVPVCLEAFSAGTFGTLGIKIVPGGKPGSPLVYDMISVRPVPSFHGAP